MDYISLVCGLMVAIAMYIGFAAGLRLGMKASHGEVPKTPVEVVTQSKKKKEVAKQAAVEADAWQQIETYDGYTEAERKLIRK